MDLASPSPPALEAPPPFRVLRPERQTMPLVFAFANGERIEVAATTIAAGDPAPKFEN